MLKKESRRTTYAEDDRRVIRATHLKNQLKHIELTFIILNGNLPDKQTITIIENIE